MVSPLSFEGFWLGVARMEREGTLPGWATDHQERSRSSRQRVLAAACRLVAADDAFTMESLATQSRLSIGALYARFPSKEAVLALLGLAIMEDGYLHIERATRDGSSATATLRAYLATIISLFRRHRAVIRALRTFRATSPELARIISRANDRIHGLVRERVRPFLPEARYEALEYALFVSSAAAREGVLYDALTAYHLDADDARLETEIHRAVTAYLELPRDAGVEPDPTP